MWSERDSHVDQRPAEVPKNKLLFGFVFYRAQEAECCVGGCNEAGGYTCECFCFLSDYDNVLLACLDFGFVAGWFSFR